MDSVYVDDKVKRYIVDLVFATRDPEAHGLDIKNLIEYGASPRASIYSRSAKAEAMMNGRAYATPDDVKEMAKDVLRHRITMTYEAEAEDITPER